LASPDGAEYNDRAVGPGPASISQSPEDAIVDVALEKRRVQRAYELYAPVYDVLFDWIFAPGRSAAIRHLGLRPHDSILEVGIGTD
jgi:hypothetical protein